MKRRSFLSLVGAASLAPALPALGAPAPNVAVGYNRYMYGLGVFHARNQAGVTAADLVARLRISPVQAHAMMREMAARGVLGSFGGATATKSATRAPYVRKALRKLAEVAVAECETPEPTLPEPAA